MPTICFTIDGPLFGYRASTSHKKDKQGRSTKKGGCFDPDYLAYKDRVLKLACVAGWKGRAISEKAWPARLCVIVSWAKEPRIDWSNCYKGIEDAIFLQDRFVLPHWLSDMKWDTGVEKIDVIVQC